MKVNETRAAILEALAKSKLLPEADIAAYDSAGGDVSLDSLDIDSLKVFDFCVALEDVLGVEIEPEEIITNNSLSSLARHLAERVP